MDVVIVAFSRETNIVLKGDKITEQMRKKINSFLKLIGLIATSVWDDGGCMFMCLCEAKPSR